MGTQSQLAPPVELRAHSGAKNSGRFETGSSFGPHQWISVQTGNQNTGDSFRIDAGLDTSRPLNSFSWGGWGIVFPEIPPETLMCSSC